MKKERMALLALSASLLMSANAHAAGPIDFTDFPNGWSAAALTHAVENGLLRGTADGKINPNGLVTRAQMAAIVARAFGVTERASLKGYTDVDENAWYYEAMEKAVAMGAFRGDGEFLHPNDPINRQEAFSVLARIYSLNEGQVETLASFQDFSMISDWAKPNTAAMVEQGYVLGNGVNIKPRNTITRAELAQILDRMARIYVTRDSAVQIPNMGNVVLRDSNTDLDNLTINGDLIIGDGAKTVKLQNVTVTGRILIRGGSKGVSLHKTTADGGVVVDNPNKVTELEVRSSKLGHVTVKSDLRLDSSKLKDLEVRNGAKVTYIHGDSDSRPSSRPDHRPNPKPDSKPDSKPDPEVKPQQETLVQEAKIVDLGWSQYLAVQFAQGKSLENCTLSVDGVDVTSAVTPVSDDGSIVKWEVSKLHHGELVVSDGRNQQRVPLHSGKDNAPAVVSASKTAPDYFLLNGPVYVWDYHLTNYDDAGDVRVTPSKTTFKLGAEKNQIASYSPDAILCQDESALPYGVSGEVQLMFNYDKGTPEEKAFVDGISDVDLVSFDEYKNTLNDHLTYELDTAFAHGDHTVACIKVPLGQTNFYSNGRYKLRVTSNGAAHLFPIHVVNEKVPTMVITGDQGASGKEVHFRVKDMDYGITCPIYRVDLTDTQGVTRTLTRFDDWFLFGDLLVLYNDHTNKFPVDGSYTVTVYADGFQPFSKTFYQSAAASESRSFDRTVTAVKPMTVDIVTSASVGGGGSSHGGDGSGSKVMNANLIVDADLMANAKIMVKLGLDNAAATGISDRWDDMSKLYVFNEGAEQIYTAEGYFDAVNTARTQGKYLSFAEYIASGSAETTLNRPYAVKQILEDNLLGESTSFHEAVSKAAPKLTLTQQSNQTAVFTCGDQAYLTKLAREGTLYLNTTYPALPADRYAVADGTLTLNNVKPGKNTLKIQVPGYQTVEIVFEMNRELEEVRLQASDITRGEPVVIACEAQHQEACDFFANVTAVTLTAPNGNVDNVKPEGAESYFEKIGFTVAGNTLTIGEDVFDQKFAQNEDGTFSAGAYTVEIEARFYGKQTLIVQVEDADAPAPDPALAPAPTVANVELIPGFAEKNHRVTFDPFDGLRPYLEKISSITLNGKPAEKKPSFWQDTNSFKLSVVNSASSVYDYDCIAFTEDCFGAGEVVVVVTAEGYAPLTFTVVDGKLSGGNAQPEVPQVKEAPAAVSLTHAPASWVAASCIIKFEAPADTADRDDVYHYIRGLTEVKVNDVVFTLNMSFGSIGDTNYDVMASAGELKFSEGALGNGTGTFVITLKSAGYADQTIQVVDGSLQ